MSSYVSWFVSIISYYWAWWRCTLKNIIHLFSAAFHGLCSCNDKLSNVAQTSVTLPSSSSSSGELWSTLRWDGMYNTPSMFWVRPGFSQWDMPGKPPQGGVKEASLSDSPNRLNWLLSTRRSSNFTPVSSVQTSRLFTLFLKVSPVTLLRKLILIACMHVLILLVVTAGSSPSSLSICADTCMQFNQLDMSLVHLAFCLCLVCHTHQSVVCCYIYWVGFRVELHSVICMGLPGRR